MIHLALSILAALFLAYCACLALVALASALVAILGAVAQLVLAPVAIVRQFVGHWRKWV